MWIVVLILTFLFASLHQTFVSSPRILITETDHIRATIMIWVTFHLGMRPDCQDSLREEVFSILRRGKMNYTNPAVDVQTMHDAVRTDSFIREVLRMKGDIVNLVRAPIRDIELGGYIIPKGTNHYLSICAYVHFVNDSFINRLSHIPSHTLVVSIPGVRHRPRAVQWRAMDWIRKDSCHDWFWLPRLWPWEMGLPGANSCCNGYQRLSYSLLPDMAN